MFSKVKKEQKSDTHNKPVIVEHMFFSCDISWNIWQHSSAFRGIQMVNPIAFFFLSRMNACCLRTYELIWKMCFFVVF
ncbi:hypothetical protein ERO13_D07G116480v2 [Gossypium hirsutum]|nr:hypothetical protein ERO13_D07G116480v2 [Gossypium hirsutum]